MIPEVSSVVPVKEQLVNIGVRELAPQVESMHPLPAGRITHFQKNWEVITKDAWVLKVVKGLEIEFSGNLDDGFGA